MRLDDGVVTIKDVLLTVHYALLTSVSDDRRRHRQTDPWKKGVHLRKDYEAVDVDSGCIGWAGLTRSPTEPDVWILMTA